MIDKIEDIEAIKMNRDEEINYKIIVWLRRKSREEKNNKNNKRESELLSYLQIHLIISWIQEIIMIEIRPNRIQVFIYLFFKS